MIDRRLFSFGLASAALAPALPAFAASDETVFVRTPVQFIAALGEPTASAGGGAERWGIWTVDPGPRGVWLRDYEELQAAGNVAPHRWTFDPTDWWLDENGLIMERPRFPLKHGKYIVTGRREVTTVLTIDEPDGNGVSAWRLDDGATLHDVTHLGCRSARYTPAAGAEACLPADAPRSAFKVPPGAAMPPIRGCDKQDYHVLFIVGVGVSKTSELMQ